MNRIALVLVLMVGFACKKKETGRELPAKEVDAAPIVDLRTAPAVDVTAGALFTAYRENEIGADARFRGKVLRVTGLVERVGKTALDEPMIVLHLAADADGMRATLASAEGAGELRRMDEVTLRCLGENFVGKPRLSGCIVDPAK